MGAIKGAKFCPSAFRLEMQRTRPTDSLSRYEAKPACAEHLCLSGSQNPCTTAVHPFSTRVLKKRGSACGCAVAVTVLVVFVVVVMVSAVVVLSLFDGCPVCIVMCPLFSVQCGCLAIDHTSFVVFHPLTSFEVKTRTIFQFF